MTSMPLASAAAAISADPAGQLLRVSPRSVDDAWRSLELAAALGVVAWLLLIVAVVWALNAARQQLSSRHTLAPNASRPRPCRNHGWVLCDRAQEWALLHVISAPAAKD